MSMRRQSSASPEAEATASDIIRCAIAVHRELGPGLLESTYEAALCIELLNSGIEFRRQVTLPALYKGEQVGLHRLDLIVREEVIVEVKSVAHLQPVFIAQALTYLRVTGVKIGLLVNFNTEILKSGIRRVVL